MSEAKVLTADDATGMSRVEALRILATADGVPERDKRLAQLMLEGPEITPHDEASIRRPRRSMMGVAVHAGLAQYGAEVQETEAAIRAEVRELGGARG